MPRAAAYSARTRETLQSAQRQQDAAAVKDMRFERRARRACGARARCCAKSAQKALSLPRRLRAFCSRSAMFTQQAPRCRVATR